MMRRLILMACLGTSTLALGQTPDLSPKPASPATQAAQSKMKASLPPDNGDDLRFAERGFIATRKDPLIKAADGRVIWNMDAYAWMKGDAPPTVNPSLWRHMTILRKHGLFKLTEGMWQVRGFDISNMTVIAGKTGWILIDPLTSAEAASAALQLVNEQLGARPVKAVIYTHSHGDHFGGVKGVMPADPTELGKVDIIAPEHFTEETASENVMAGAAMGRRANFQFGSALKPGPQGQMGSGIGVGLSGGQLTLLRPTRTILKTGEVHTVDGVTLEFQMVPESEAPAEMNVMVPERKALVIGEIATCSLHNILTPRGAKVRDAHKWAAYLTEAVRIFGNRSETFASSHCWPRFGTAEISRYLGKQRDTYKYLHDQTVRAMNNGATPVEIAEVVTQPDSLSSEWTTRGYYGTFNHNSKAVYQRYLGWYDANPANLNPHVPTERGKRMVAAMGGADKVMANARDAMSAGDYRWASDLLNQLVFAEPGNVAAKALLADSFEQQGYQAESAIWRNQFLMAAHELRAGTSRAVATSNPEVVAAIPTGLLLDSLATRLDPARLANRALAFNIVLPDRQETARIAVANGVMVSEMGASDPAPAATITTPRQLLLGLFLAGMPLGQMQAAGLKVEGDVAALKALIAAIETPAAGFPIVTP